jgi:hypothetical protein
MQDIAAALWKPLEAHVLSALLLHLCGGVRVAVDGFVALRRDLDCYATCARGCGLSGLQLALEHLRTIFSTIFSCDGKALVPAMQSLQAYHSQLVLAVARSRTDLSAEAVRTIRLCHQGFRPGAPPQDAEFLAQMSEASRSFSLFKAGAGGGSGGGAKARGIGATDGNNSLAALLLSEMTAYQDIAQESLIHESSSVAATVPAPSSAPAPAPVWLDAPPPAPAKKPKRFSFFGWGGK